MNNTDEKSNSVDEQFGKNSENLFDSNGIDKNKVLTTIATLQPEISRLQQVRELQKSQRDARNKNRGGKKKNKKGKKKLKSKKNSKK